MNWPNRLSLLRMVLGPVFMVLLLDERRGFRIAALAVFLVASLTDLYDGYLARRYGWVTNLGKFLDPLADKLLVAFALIGLSRIELVPVLALYLVIGRELLVTGLRAIAAYAGVLILPSRLGKLKTVAQMLALVLYMLYSVLYVDGATRGPFLRAGGEGSGMLLVADGVLLAAVVLTLGSGVDYFFRNRSLLAKLVQ